MTQIDRYLYGREEEITNKDADHFFKSHFNRSSEIRIPKIAEFTNLTSCIPTNLYLNVDKDDDEDDVGYILYVPFNVPPF